MTATTKIRFSKPTEQFPFFHNVAVNTATGWQRVVSIPTDGRSKGPALFPTRDEMIRGVKRLLKSA